MRYSALTITEALLDPALIGKEVLREQDGKRGLLRKGPLGGYYVEVEGGRSVVTKKFSQGVVNGEWKFLGNSELDMWKRRVESSEDFSEETLLGTPWGLWKDTALEDLRKLETAKAAA